MQPEEFLGGAGRSPEAAGDACNRTGLHRELDMEGGSAGASSTSGQQAFATSLERRLESAVEDTQQEATAEVQGDEGLEDASGCAAEEGRCFMMDTKFRMVGGRLVAAADLSIGDEVLDYQGNASAITWCRKLPRRKRLLVNLHSQPLTVTSTHRVVVPAGEVIAKHLRDNDVVLLGSEHHRLAKVTTYFKTSEVMELEFAGDATIEVHSPSILTKGSDPTAPIDQEGCFKVKLEHERPMDTDTELGSSIVDRFDGVELPEESWPDTEDDLR